MSTALDTAHGFTGQSDQQVRKSSQSLETDMEHDAPKQRGCCCKFLNCFFCYLPWVSIVLCGVCMASAIVSLATIRQAALKTGDLMKDLGFADSSIVPRLLRAVPLAVLVSLIVMITVVVAVALLAVLRSNQRAVHSGMYGHGCCQRPCCYWGLILPGWLVTAVWWILMVLTVVLLLALVLWLAVFMGIYYASGYASEKSTGLSDKLNAAQAKILSDVKGFVDNQNKAMQDALKGTPPLLMAWNNVTAPLKSVKLPEPGTCSPGCLDVSMFQDVFGSKKCICAKEELDPLKAKAHDIAQILFVAFISTWVLYLSASLLLVTLTQGNTNAYRDKNELKRVRQELKDQKRHGQFIQSPDMEVALR